MASKTRDTQPVLQRYVFTNLAVARARLVDTEDNEDRSRKHQGHERARPIRQHDIDVTGQNYPHCKCEHLGLHAGMTVDSLIRLGAGCTEGDEWRMGYVCPRLDRLRRIYGH